MKKEINTHSKMGVMERFSSSVTAMTGTTPAFIIAFGLVLVWAATGPAFDFSEEWQMMINTGTTIVTFLMVFLIQKSQNKDSLAIQLKLNELVASNKYSSNSLVDIGSMTEEEMIIIQKYYHKLSELAKEEVSIKASHSIDEAHDLHQLKDKNRIKTHTKPK